MSKIAVVQHPPVLGDRGATLARAAEIVEEARAGGAQLIVFPEAYVPGYPTYIWRLRPGGDMALSNEIHARMLSNAVDLGAGDLSALSGVAEKHGVDILVGVDEIDREQSRSTLYNSYIHIGNDGAIANVHRKLMPTNPERMVWGFGDGRGLRVVETSVGRVGSLICWENFMPLARMALYSQGIDLHVAPTWDSSDGWVGTMQHIAREGRCYVAGCCSAMSASDVPDDFPGREQLFPDADERINRGMSLVVAPGGEIIAGPLEGESGILYADVDANRVRDSRRSLDVAGHYNRPDVFTFEVDRRPKRSAHFED
jgi:nitrilase